MSTPKAQDAMTLIHELVKVLSLYANTGVDQRTNIVMTQTYTLEFRA